MLYVIYPAEELLEIYDTPIYLRRRIGKLLNTSSETAVAAATSSNTTANNAAVKGTRQYSRLSVSPFTGAKKAWEQLTKTFGDKKPANDNTQEQKQQQKQKRQQQKENRKSPVYGAEKQQQQRRGECGAKRAIMQNNRSQLDEGANPLKDLTHANLNEPLKQHNGNAVKLVQTVSEFTKALGSAMECHGQNVIRLVDDFRERSSESRSDTGSMRRLWDSLLRQVEADATAHMELASVLQQQLSRPVLESCFHRKVQHRKVFTHREAYEQVVAKTEEKLQRARNEYKRAYGALLSTPEPNQDSELKRAYLEAHNAYVLQLRATNAIAERYQFHCLPGLLAEVAEVYEELCALTCNCVAGISEAAGDRVVEQSKRYQALSKEVKVVNAQADLQVLARSLSTVAQPRKPPRRLFVPPTPPEQTSSERMNSVPTLRDELVPTGASSLPMMEEDLKMEADRLTQEITHLQGALDTLTRMQRKSAEGNLYTKVAELQEDISMKRFDLGVAQLHLAAVNAQKELFSGSGGGGGSGAEAAQPDGVGNRKMSNGSTGSTKHKWLKAFKSLKTTPTTPPPNEKGKQAMYHAVSTVVAMSKKNVESESGGHQWREYTYRRITPCDACGQVLRGHARQGFRCRNCKANAHVDCMSSVQPANCPSLLPKRTAGIPLLRRQKSTAPPVDETPTAEQRQGSGSSTSVTRQFGQPLVFSNDGSSPTRNSVSPQRSPRSSLHEQKRSNSRKR